MTPARVPMAEALHVAAVFAVAPASLGGVLLCGAASTAREAWRARLAPLLAPGPLVRIPPGVGEDRLLGGLDLPATLAAGRPVAQAGLLAEADGGAVILPMVERAPSIVVSVLSRALDEGRVTTAREGVTETRSARLGVVALDESLEDEESVDAGLADRLALHLSLDLQGYATGAQDSMATCDVEAARMRFADVTATLAQLEAMVAASLAFGIASIRAPILAARTARAHAALAGRTCVDDVDLAFAARFVLAPRALVIPEIADEEQTQEETPPPREPQSETSESARDDNPRTDEELAELLLEATRAALPPDLLDSGPAKARQRGGEGTSGAAQVSARRGRPLTPRAGELRSGARLDVLATLRTAAPWQRLRRGVDASRTRLDIRASDFRLKRYKQRSESALIFIVDASGSAAAQRLAEAKGAVELLLAEAYVRRDRVSLISMRGAEAELMLPPTRALAAAKRRLAGLPGGGGTPLASGIEAGLRAAVDARKRGWQPTLILLTDGKANIARDGTPGRAQAMMDARVAAGGVLIAGLEAILIDTSPRRNAAAAELAAAMGARYAAMPYADAARMRSVVREAAR